MLIPLFLFFFLIIPFCLWMFILIKKFPLSRIKREYSSEEETTIAGSIMFASVTSIIFCTLLTLIWLFFLTKDYLDVKSNLRIIDEKIEVTEEINKQKIDSVIPILEKYPELEKETVNNIDPNAFAILGDVYPNLKSNESYNQQAAIVEGNINKIEQLKLEKIDYKKVLFTTSYQLWFLK